MNPAVELPLKVEIFVNRQKSPDKTADCTYTKGLCLVWDIGLFVFVQLSVLRNIIPMLPIVFFKVITETIISFGGNSG